MNGITFDHLFSSYIHWEMVFRKYSGSFCAFFSLFSMSKRSLWYSTTQILAHIKKGSQLFKDWDQFRSFDFKLYSLRNWLQKMQWLPFALFSTSIRHQSIPYAAVCGECGPYQRGSPTIGWFGSILITFLWAIFIEKLFGPAGRMMAPFVLFSKSSLLPINLSAQWQACDMWHVTCGGSCFQTQEWISNVPVMSAVARIWHVAAAAVCLPGSPPLWSPRGSSHCVQNLEQISNLQSDVSSGEHVTRGGGPAFGDSI